MIDDHPPIRPRVKAWEVLPSNPRIEGEEHEPPCCRLFCGAAYVAREGDACDGCVADGIACESCRREHAASRTRLCVACHHELANR